MSMFLNEDLAPKITWSIIADDWKETQIYKTNLLNVLIDELVIDKHRFDSDSGACKSILLFKDKSVVCLVGLIFPTYIDKKIWTPSVIIDETFQK